MRRFLARACMAVVALLGATPALAAPVVVTAELRGAIGPPAASYFERVLEHAREREAELVVLSLDTPGGLDTSMREMIQAMLGSPVPVAIYVAPRGARAASAGTYLLYASHVAAMAPGTNTGAATPVAIGVGGPRDAPRGDPGDDGASTERDKGRATKPPAPADATVSERKALRDAVAYLRSLAEMRGRNADWAEKAVLESDSLPASQALKQKVIDFVATDVDDLLRQADGFRVSLATGARALALAGAEKVAVEQNFKERLLGTIANPNVALLLMMLAVYGLLIEFYVPGTGLPGVLGGVALLLGLYGLALLPVNIAGVALVLLGLALMIAEAFMPSFGVLGLGGVVAFVLGAFLALDDDLPGFTLDWQLLVPVVIVNAVALAAIGAYALRSRRRPVSTGSFGMLGATAVALEDVEREGWFRVAGERWWGRTSAPVAQGGQARVTAIDGLTLSVEPIDKGGTT